MTDWKTIRIPEDDFKRHNERRRELGVRWVDYIDGQAPEMQWIGDNVEIEPLADEPDYDRIREIVREETRAVLEDKFAEKW